MPTQLISVHDQPTIDLDKGPLYHLQPIYQLQTVDPEPPKPENSGFAWIGILLAGWVLFQFLPVFSNSLVPGSVAIQAIPKQPISPSPVAPSAIANNSGFKQRVIVATDGRALNARSGPGIEFEVTQTYSSGTTLEITGRRSNGWVEVINGEWVAENWIAVVP